MRMTIALSYYLWWPYHWVMNSEVSGQWVQPTSLPPSLFCSLLHQQCVCVEGVHAQWVALTILLSFAVQVLATLDAQLHSSSHLAVMPQTQTEESIGLLTRELRRMEAHPWALRKQNACLSCHTPLRSTLTGPVKVKSQPQHFFLKKSFFLHSKKENW